MNCERAQAMFSGSIDDAVPLSSDVEGHLWACGECASFRDVTLAVERRYRARVLTGIDRMRRLEASPQPARKRGRARMLLPLAAAVVLGAWGMVGRDAAAPVPVGPAPLAMTASAPSRSLLFDEVRLFEESGLPLSFLEVGEPSLPIRLDQDVHRGLSTPEIALPRDLRF